MKKALQKNQYTQAMKTRIIKLAMLAGLSLLLLSGCKKDIVLQPSSTTVTTMNDLKVSSTFNWEMTREVSLNLGMNFPNIDYQYNAVTIFDGDPAKGGNLIYQGFMGNNDPMIAKMRIPTAVPDIYVQLTPWGETNQIVKIAVAGNIAYIFTPTVEKSVNDPASVVDCGTYDHPLSGSGTANINDGEVHAILFGTSYSGTINVTKGTLKICGTFTGVLTMGDSHHNSWIIISSTGVATVSSFSKDKNSVLQNFGTLTINSNFSPKVLIENTGTMTVNGHYNMNGSNGDLVNNGTVTISNDWNSINHVTNNHFIEVFGSMNANYSTFLNACKLTVHGNLNLNKCEFTNQTGYIKCDGELKVEGGTGFMKLIDQSMIETYDLTLNKDITGITTGGAPGTKSEIKVTHDLTFNGPKVITGTIETAQTTGVIHSGNMSNFTGGATFVSFANMINSIPSTSCNNGGTEPPPPPPPVNNWVTGTAVYEDLWPGKGDYDVNDLVMAYKFKLVTNNQNKVTDIVVKLLVRAVGAGFRNGFGIQFDNLSPSNIASVTGYNLQHSYISLASNGTENGQSKAVVIAFDDATNVIHMGAYGSFFNTQPGVPVGTSDTVTLNIHLTTPMLSSVIGAPPYNPFLIRNLERQAEIHLPNYLPTSLAANCSYFGQGDDSSDPGIGRYYKTVNNLPWALNIPVVFDYPWEQTSILSAYNYFATWAQSDGALHPDWYLNLTGYRNSANIWHQ
jgi:LruC domain-containing protein